MNITKTGNAAVNLAQSSQGINLASDEVKLQRTIKNMKIMIKHIEILDHQPDKVKRFRTDIEALQVRLHELKARRSNA